MPFKWVFCVLLLSVSMSVFAAEAPLRVTPETMTFVAATEGETPPARTLSVWLADRARTWVVKDDLEWLTVTPTSVDGSVSGMTARVAVNHQGMISGEYEGVVKINLKDNPKRSVGVPIGLRIVDAKKVWNVGDRRQMFIDRRFIEAEENVTLDVNPPQKLGLIRGADGKPWEQSAHVSRVIDDQGAYKLYYGADVLHIAEPVYWKNSTDLSSLQGVPVRLYFELRRTKLYAFQFLNDATIQEK